SSMYARSNRVPPAFPTRRSSDLAAVGGGARIIVFDEPTSSLSQAEAERLFALIERLKARGVTCIYVSHRMPEIFRLCDAVTILRDRKSTRLNSSHDSRSYAVFCL